MVNAKVEYRAITQEICELIWIQRLMTELNMLVTGPMKLFNDIKSAINVVYNPIQHDRMKHEMIDRDFIKTKIKNGIIALSYIPTKSQEIDVISKVLRN